MEACSIDVLVDDMLRLVLWEAREYRPALVAVCQRWAALADQAPPRSLGVLRPRDLAARGHASLLAELEAVWPFLVERNERLLVRKAARGGLAAFCDSRRFRVSSIVATDTLIGAARGGHYELAREAHAAILASEAGHPNGVHVLCDSGHTGYCEAFRGALRGGHAGICDLIVSRLLRGADDGGCRDCRGRLACAAVARDIESGGEWAPPGPMWAYLETLEPDLTFDAETLLGAAAENGSERLCYRAKARGAHDVKTMLKLAAKGGHVAICGLAVGWGAHPGMVLDAAIKAGSAEVCSLARELRGTAPDRSPDRTSESFLWHMLEGAAFLGQEHLVSLAIEWGALRVKSPPRRSLNNALLINATAGICALLCAHGADDYEALWRRAIHDGRWATALFAIQRGAPPSEPTPQDRLSAHSVAETLFSIAARAKGAACTLNDVLHAACRPRLPLLLDDVPRGDVDGSIGFGLSPAESIYGPGICRSLLESWRWEPGGPTRAASACVLLRCARSSRWRELCGVAVDFGARDFAGMLDDALGAGNEEMAALARRWGRLP